MCSIEHSLENIAINYISVNTISWNMLLCNLKENEIHKQAKQKKL